MSKTQSRKCLSSPQVFFLSQRKGKTPPDSQTHQLPPSKLASLGLFFLLCLQQQQGHRQGPGRQFPYL